MSNFQWQPVRERIFVTRLQPHGVNAGLIVGDNEALLVDTGSSAQQGAALLAAAQAQAGVPVSHVMITHAHHDHWFGLAGMPGISSIAHEGLTSPDAASEVADEAAANGLTELPQPTRTFSLAVALDLGNRRVEMIHLGAAHTSSDVYVVVPDQDVIFAGDLIEESGEPQFGPTSSGSNWPMVLDGVIGATTDDTVIVPGHGSVVDRYFAIRQQGDIAMFCNTAESLFEQGVGLAEAVTSAQWPDGAQPREPALSYVYAECERRGIVPKRQLPITAI
ncbi:MAG: MBL fold metallo-hydrolase [Arachnia sp.]